MDILQRIIEKKQEEIENLKKIEQYLYEQSVKYKKHQNKRNRFIEEFSPNALTIIGEIKKASPSRGIIKEDFDITEIAKIYKEIEKIKIISVLTERNFFMGDISFLKIVKDITHKPILRKDFIIEKVQIYESVLNEADSILLIVRLLSLDKLKELITEARKFNLEPLVEIHNEEELEKALQAQASIIGINNRDLKDFSVDINRCLRLVKNIPNKIIKIAESGIENVEQLKTLKEAGFDGVLIGEYFMRNINKLKWELKK